MAGLYLAPIAARAGQPLQTCVTRSRQLQGWSLSSALGTLGSGQALATHVAALLWEYISMCRQRLHICCRSCRLAAVLEQSLTGVLSQVPDNTKE